MNPEDVEARIIAELPDCEVRVEGGDGRFTVVAVGSCFEGLPRVRRQQRINACLRDALADGRIHAVSMRTFTPAEWSEWQQEGGRSPDG